MSGDIVVASPQTRTFRAGWGWLLLSALTRFYLGFVAALAACALLPMFFGLTGAVVQSGSMEPRINAGDVVLSRAIPTNAPPPLGRVITFRAPSGSTHSGNVLHRLVAENKDGSLVTAGDANHDPDSTPLARRDIISRACLLIPWVGLPSFWVTTGSFLPLGIWVLLTMGALMFTAVDAASGEPPQRRSPPRSPGRSPGSGEDPECPAESIAGSPERPAPSLLSRLIEAIGPRTLPLTALAAIVALVVAPLGLAGTSFSARTFAVGNSWATSGPATRLSFTTQPSGSTGGIAFGTQPVVTVQDAHGDTVGVSNAPITLSITTPAGATLTCAQNPRSAVLGVATFAGCGIDKAGTYTLTATSGTLTQADSASFTITVGSARRLDFTTDPSGSSPGIAFGTQPVVAVQDAGGNTVTSSAASVALSITTPAGAVLTCTANPKSAVSGVVNYSACAIDDPGTYTLTAAASGLTSAVSASFTITPAPATKLAFTTNPSNSTGGTAFGTQPVVTVQDAGGNRVTGSVASVDLSITTPAGAVLTCTEDPKSAVSGVVAFAGCNVDKIGTYTLTAASSGLTSAVSASFAITVGPAAKLGFTRVPSTTAVNTSFALQPRVAIQDAGGNTRTASSASVLLAITPPTGGATLTNCSSNPRSTSSGVATFANCRISTAGTYTLTATASGLTSAISTSFVIFGPATRLDVTTDPSDSTGGTAFGTQPVVTVQDAGGRTVSTSTASVTLSITTPAGAVLSCTLNPKSAAAGVATYAGCKVTKAGTYTLTATASGLTSAVSASFTITVGPASKLAFTTSPSGSTGGIAFGAQPVVTVQDAGGNTVTSSTAPVTVSITTPAGATLTCSENPEQAVSGVATFAGCGIDKIGTYTLTAASTGLTSATSVSFAISVGPAVQLGFTRSPTDTPVNTGFSLQPMVAIQDAGGNTRSASSATVTLTITTPAGGAVLTCSNNPRTSSSGVASFSSCEIDTAGTYTLTASASGGLTSAVSTSFTITGGA